MSSVDPTRELLQQIGLWIGTRANHKRLPVGDTRRRLGKLLQRGYAAWGVTGTHAWRAELSALQEAVEGLLRCPDDGAQWEVALRAADRAQAELMPLLAASQGREEAKEHRPEAADYPTHTRRTKATINARMLEVLQGNITAMGWSSTQWARKLQCSRSAIVGTETWKTSEMAREKNRAERTRDRRQNRQHYSRSD